MNNESVECKSGFVLFLGSSSIILSLLLFYFSSEKFGLNVGG
jgi:hypothetical protein